jgi:hypothetical protein
MSDRLTRRAVAAAAAASVASLPALAEGADPILALAARYHAATQRLNAKGCSDEEGDRHYELLSEAENTLSEMMPVSLAGATAQVRYAITSMEMMMGPDDVVSPLELCWLNALRNAAAFMEARASA